MQNKIIIVIVSGQGNDNKEIFILYVQFWFQLMNGKSYFCFEEFDTKRSR